MNKPPRPFSTEAVLAFGSRIRPSAYFEASRRWGCVAYSVYNHFYMPAVYESPQADYDHLINAVTLWDVAGERQTQIRGKDAAAFVQTLTPRNLSTCTPGKCRYILMTNENGGVINDPVLLRLDEETFWLSAADSDIHLWCRGLAHGSDFEVEIDSPDVSPLQLQGPRAAEVAEKCFGDWVKELAYFHLREFDWNGIPLVISRTGWSGEFGYEIYLRNGEHGDTLWERIMEAGKPFGIRPACPSPIRRIEAGLLSYGADVNEDDTPYHVNLDRLVDLDGGFDFIGKSALRAIHAKGITRRLVGVVMDGDPLSAPLVRWWKVMDKRGALIGRLRSAVYSHTLGKNIGLAMINKPHDAVGGVVTLHEADGESRRATISPVPFLPHKTR